MKIIASQTGDASRARGERVMQNLAQALGRQITAVYAHNDEMALGAIQALKAAGRRSGTDVIVVSIDGQRWRRSWRGSWALQGRATPLRTLAFQTIELFRANQTIPPKILLTDRLFDKSNAAQFLNDAY